MPQPPTSEKTVLIIGGGYAGSAMAQKLDPYFNVKLIEVKDKKFHSIGALRATVDPTFARNIFIPYDRLLKRGKVIRDETVEINKRSVKLRGGEEIAFDYLVLAMGTTNPFPAKAPNDSELALAQYSETHERILIIGGGPVGVELAGEIATEFPSKKITLVHSGPTLIPGSLPDAWKQKVGQLLQGMGVTVLLNERVNYPKEKRDLEETNIFTTNKGTSIEADMVFLAIGNTPNNAPLKPKMSHVLSENGFVKVNEFFQVEGHNNIFAIGDIADLKETKMAAQTKYHVETVFANIRSIEKSGSPSKPYGGPLVAMMVSLGRNSGLGTVSGITMGPFLSKHIKSKHMLAPKIWSSMNMRLPN